MSYIKSQARIQFEDNAKGLMELAKAVQKQTCLTYEQKEKVFLSVIVFLCSAMEDYQKDIIESCFYRMLQQHVNMGSIHVNARIFTIMNSLSDHFKNYIFDKGKEKNTINIITKQKEQIRKLLSEDEVFDICWLSKALWGDKKHPSVKNMPVLYNRVGIPNIFNVLSVKGHKDYKTKLDSLIDLRASAAHSMQSSVTLNDIKDYYKFLCDFIYMLDKELYCHFCKLSGANIWPKR